VVAHAVLGRAFLFFDYFETLKKEYLFKNGFWSNSNTSRLEIAQNVQNN